MNRELGMNDLNETKKASCRGKIDSTKRTDRQTRRVRFQPRNCTTFVGSNQTSHTLKDSKHLVWYQAADIKKFQTNDDLLIRKYRSFVRNNQRLGRNMSNDMEKMEMEAEMRGLEENFNILSQLRHQRRLEDSCRAVLIEQQRQRDLWSNALKDDQAFLLDVELVRKVYSSSAMNAKLIAYSLGRADAAFARQFQKNSKDCKIGTKIEETKSALQRDSAQHHIKPKKEKMITNATASAILRQRHLGHINALNVAVATRVSI